MRIISGVKKGIVIKAPKKLPIRPTTDFCKESLFNIVENNFDIETMSVLDLFSGSGNISFEFASRGCKTCISVDQDFGCYKFITDEAKKLEFNQIKTYKSEVLKYLDKTNQTFDLIFADPPYAYKDYIKLIELVFDKKLIKTNGWFVLEHSTHEKINFTIPPFDLRKYGQSTLSFYKIDNFTDQNPTS